MKTLITQLMIFSMILNVANAGSVGTRADLYLQIKRSKYDQYVSNLNLRGEIFGNETPGQIALPGKDLRTKEEAIVQSRQSYKLGLEGSHFAPGAAGASSTAQNR